MAKFCANCGAQMDDFDRVCGQCGTPDMNVPADNMGMPPMQGDMGMGMPPMQGDMNMGMPPMQGDMNMGMPPMQGDMGMGMPPMQGDMGMGMPPMQGDMGMNGPMGGNMGMNMNGPMGGNMGMNNPMGGKKIKLPKPAGQGNNDASKYVKLGIIAVVAIIVIVIFANILSSFTGYKATLNKMVKAIANDDIDTLEKIASSVSEEQIADYYGKNKDPYDVYESRVDDTLDTFEDRVGEVKKITYKIVDTKELSDRRLEDIKDEWVDNYNLDTDDIKKIVEVEIKLSVKGKKKSASYNVDRLYMIKESGKWKVLYGDLYRYY
ncbi:MAG: hypothetical protein KBS96_06790 [Lachnospiraceae bacterium]|nr:hypothetical protein [Candidatus Colinaster scatohippi]